MVKLDRIDQPIFAGNNVSADENVAIFGSMKTSPSYTMDLPTLLASSDYQKGWQYAVAVGYAPFLEEMNGVQYGFSYQLAYLQQQGIPEWTGTTTYYKGSLAKLNTANGCQLYSSKIDNNTGNLLTDSSSWQLVLDSSVSYATTTALNNLRNDAVLLSGNQTVAGVKTFSSNPIAPTPTSSDSSTKVATTAFVKDNLKNFSVNIAGGIDLALNLDTSYTFPSSGLFVVTVYVKSQSDPTVNVRMKDTAGADATSTIICQIAHHGGTAEYNKIPFSIYVQKGQSIYLQRSGGGTVSVSHTYLFPVML